MASQSVALTAAIIRGHAGAMKPAAHLHDALRAQLRPIYPHKMDAHPGAAPARYLVFTARNKGLSGPNSPHRLPGVWPGPSIQSTHAHASPSPPVSPREAAPVAAKGADAPTAAAASEGVAAGGAGAGGNMIKKRGGCLASHLHGNVYLCVCVCVCVCVSLCVCVCVCVYIYLHMYMYIYIHICTLTCIHTHAHHAHTHTHTHAHMHMYVYVACECRHMYVYVAYEYRRELGVASAQKHAGQSPAQKDEAVGSD